MTTYNTAQRQRTENHNRLLHRRENLKSETSHCVHVLHTVLTNVKLFSAMYYTKTLQSPQTIGLLQQKQQR
jgi:hypothetical protein